MIEVEAVTETRATLASTVPYRGEYVLRGCPRCHGDLRREQFVALLGPRTGWVCIQCGYELSAAPQPAQAREAVDWDADEDEEGETVDEPWRHGLDEWCPVEEKRHCTNCQQARVYRGADGETMARCQAGHGSPKPWVTLIREHESDRSVRGWRNARRCRDFAPAE